MGVIIVIIVLVRFWCSKWPTRIHITWLWCQDVSNCYLVKKGQQIRATPKRIFHRGRCSLTGCLLDMAGHLEAVGVVAVWETDCLCGFPEVFSLLYTSTSSHPPTRPAVRTLVAPFPPRPLGRISPALFLTSPTDWWPSPSSPPTHHFCHRKCQNMPKAWSTIYFLTKANVQIHTFGFKEDLSNKLFNKSFLF